jgi:serine/threonine protein kinase
MRRLEPSPEESLYDLLVALYGDDGEALIRFLQFGEQGDDVAANLPGKDAPMARIAGQAVPLLKHRGLLTPPFFERLRQRFPRREPAIRSVRERWLAPSEPSASHPPVGEPTTVEPRRFYQQQLDDAQRRRRLLQDAGQTTAVVDEEVKRIKRQLRQGNALSQGDVLADRYWLLDRIGAGGFGTVWRARDEVDDRVVAIKLLHAQESQDASKRQRFFRGARAMRRLDHPAVVKIFDPECTDVDTHFFVMEYIDGVNLERAILDRRLARGQIFAVVAKIGEALARAHAAGMVHRDVKPSNILIDSHGEPRLTDFDLVRADDTTGGTRQGGMGTFVYSAPEMYQDANQADHRADVFGLAMTTVFCLLGGPLPLEVLRHEDRVFARLGTSTRVKDVLRKAIEWAPAKRHQSVTEFCADLLAAARYRQAGALELLVLASSAVVLILALVLPGQCTGPSTPPADDTPVEREPPPQLETPPTKSTVAETPKRAPPPDVPEEFVKELPPADPQPETPPEVEPKPKPEPEPTRRPIKKTTPAEPVAKATPLTAALRDRMLRECEDQQAEGAGCSGVTATVQVSLGPDGVITDASPRGRGSARTLAQCVARKLTASRHSTAAAGELEFSCDDP